MDKKTIGGFMAALRKAQGFTQQDVADRLNVSNKTVSKWERDESSPDIALIPAIAELYGVTCEEILLGGRLAEGSSKENKAPKVEKQIRRVINSTVTRLKNMTCISTLLAVVGLILVFSVSYAFYKPIIGFGLCAVCAAVGVILEIIQCNTATDLLGGENLSDETGALESARVTVYRCAFAAFAANIAAFIFALPFILVRDEYYMDSVITFDSYLSFALKLILPCLLAAGCLMYRVRDKLALPGRNSFLFRSAKSIRKMGLIQLGLCVCGLILLTVLKAWVSDDPFPYAFHFMILFYAGFISSIIAVLFFAIKAKRKTLRVTTIFSGVRNLFLSYAVLRAIGGIQTYSISDENGNAMGIFRYYDQTALIPAICAAAAAITLYLIAKFFILRRTGDGELY